jgi:hypothetical protein
MLRFSVELGTLRRFHLRVRAPQPTPNHVAPNDLAGPLGRGAMIELGIILVVGFGLGYAARSYVSHRRRVHAKRGHPNAEHRLTLRHAHE